MSKNKQHFIIIEPNTGGFTIEKKIEKWTNDGWKITSVTAQNVSTGNSIGHTSGGYLILIEKKDEE